MEHEKITIRNNTDKTVTISFGNFDTVYLLESGRAVMRARPLEITITDARKEAK